MATDIITLGIACDSKDVVTASRDLDGLSVSGRNCARSTESLKSSFQNLAGYIKAAAAAWGLSKLAEYAKDAANLAARVETLGVVMKVVGANAGYTGSQMESFTAGLKKMGITTQESMSSLIKMAGAQMDLTKANQLARVAQDAAVIGGINSSEAFSRMIQGIRSGEVEILKTIGINVQFEAAYQKTAAALGKTSKELTDVEKTTARMNAVLAFGANIVGAYEASMSTAGKQMLSMARYTEELKLKVGQIFTPALTSGVGTLVTSLKFVDANFNEIKISAMALSSVLIGVLAGRAAQALATWATTMQVQFALLKLEMIAAGTATTTFGMAAAGAAGMMNALKVAIASNPVGLIIAALTTAIGLWMTYTKVQSDAINAKVPKDNPVLVNLRESIGLLQQKIKLLRESKGMEGVTDDQVKELNKLKAHRQLIQFDEGDTPASRWKVTGINLQIRELESGIKKEAELKKQYSDMTATTTPTDTKAAEKAAAKAAREAAKAARGAEQWRKTYSDLQLEIDKLNPALDDHAQKIADINNKYTDLERKKGANITKLEGLRIALIAATRAQWDAAQAAEAHKLAMEEIDAAMTKYAAMKDKVDSSQPDFDLKQASDEMQMIVEDAIRFGDMVPGTIDKAANAVNRIASEYADKMVSYMRNAQQEAKDLADVIRQNTVDEADLKASQAEDNAGFFGTGLVDAQLEAEKAAIHAKYEAERQAIQDQMDLINAKSTYEIEAIDRAHQAAMLAIETETRAKYADNKPMMDKALGEQAAAEKAYQSKLLKNRESDAKKTNAMLAALSKAFTLTQKKEQQAIVKVEQQANQQKLGMYADYAVMASSVLSQIADAQDQNSRKGFETAKAFNLAAAVVATAAGIMSAFSAPDNTTMAQKVAAAALVAATGAIQIAEIASTSYGSGGSVKAPSGSFNAGSGESSLGSTSGIGSKIGVQYGSIYDSQTQESLQALAASADSASLAIGKVADGLTDIASLFDDDSYLSMAVGALPSSKLKYTSMGDTIKDTLTNIFLPTSFSSISKSISGIGKALFGGSWYTKSAGIALSMTGSEVDVDDYLHKKKSGGVFGKTKKKYVYTDDDVWTGIIQTTVDSIASTINHAAVAMGTTSNFSAASLGMTRIKTTGRSEEDIAEDLQAWLESASNALAKTVDGLEEYTFYNENAFDALVRLSTALQSSNEGLELVGATLIDSTLAGANAAYLMQELMGGAEEFADAIDTYFSSMFSDAEQEAMTAAQATRQVATAFGEMGVAVPQTKEQFRQMVNALDLNTEHGAAMFAALMDVSEAFGTAADYATEFAKAQQDLNSDAQVRIMNLTGRENEAEILSLQIQQQQELHEAQEQGLNVTTLLTAQAMELADAYKQQSDAAAEAVAELQKTNDSLLASLWQDQGKAAESLAMQRHLEIDGMDSTTLAIKMQIYALADQATAVTASTKSVSDAFSVLQASVSSEKETIKAQYDAAKEAQQTVIDNLGDSISGLASLSDSLKSSIESLTETTWAQAQAQLDEAINKARSGNFVESDSLSTALSVLSSPNADMYATLEDFNRDKGVTAGKLAELQTLTDSQLTTEEKTLAVAKNQLLAIENTYTAEISRLDAILAAGQAQVNAINGTTAATISVAMAVSNLSAAFVSTQASKGTSTTTTSSFSEASYLAKNPDVAAAIQAGAFTSGYQHYIMYGVKEGRSFAVGTNFVPYDMPANVHEGERIIPKADNYELIKRLDTGSASYDELVTEIKALRAENKAQATAIARTNQKMADILDKWDIDGMPAEAAA